MLKLAEKYKYFDRLRKQVQEVKEDSLQRIKVIVASGDGHTFNDFKVSGAIGQCAPVKPQGNHAQFVSGTEVGVGGVNNWYIGGIDNNKTLAQIMSLLGYNILISYHCSTYLTQWIYMDHW